MTAAITTQDLRRSFGDNHAVDGVDLEVQAGEIYGFLGPNGAGKSTMVKVLCTLISPTGGTATVAGYDVATQAGDIRLRIGVALQDASLDPKQTGRELLQLQGMLYGLSKPNIKRRMDDVIGLVDIGTAIDELVESYSGGMKRRLDLAMSLIHKPQILFLDEPTTGLDPVSRNDVWQEVRTLNEQEGMTIFLTTQYLEEADELAGRVGIIANGRLEAEGTPGGAETPHRHRPDRRQDRRRPRCGGRRRSQRRRHRERRDPRRRTLGVDERRCRSDLRGGRRTERLEPASDLIDPAHADARRRLPRCHRRQAVGQSRDRRHERGGRIMTDTSITHAAARRIEEAPLARRSTVIHDLATIARRACRSVFREPEFFIPALITPVFFFVVNIGALQDVAESGAALAGEQLDFKAFQLPVAIIFAVTGVSRASALVIDIQDGYFDRLLLTPVRRPALLLGLMAADLMAVMMLAIPVTALGSGPRRQLRDRHRRDPRVPRLRRAVGVGVRRLPVRDRAQDRQPGCRELELRPVLPVRVPHDELPAEGSAHRMALDDRHLQPGHVRAGGPAVTDHRGLGVGGPRSRVAGDSRGHRGQLRSGRARRCAVAFPTSDLRRPTHLPFALRFVPSGQLKSQHKRRVGGVRRKVESGVVMIMSAGLS